MTGRPRLPQHVPGFSQVRVAITEQDVGLPPLGERRVRELVSEMPFEWAFAHTARIDAVISHGRLRRRAPAAQLALVAALFDGHPKRLEIAQLVQREQREAVNTPYIHALQRLLVVEARDGNEERPDDFRRLQDAILGLSNVVSPASAEERRYDRDRLLALTIRSGVLNSTESIVEAISRAYTIYHEMPRRHGASSVPNYMPATKWEPDGSRTITVHERFMVGMAVLGAVGVWGDQLPPPERPTGVPPDYFDALAAELSNGDSARLARGIAGDRRFYRQMFAREQRGLAGNISNSIPFQVRPLLELSTGGWLLSSTNALTSWMTRGVHYACLTPIERTKEGHEFLSYVGRLFEAYGVELLGDAYRDRSHVRVLGEQPYDNGSSRTSDLAIVDGSDLVLLELEAHRFSKEALLRGDTAAVLRELDVMIVEKARQLDRCISALLDDTSDAALPGVDLSSIDQVWPVVVIEGGVVQTPLLYDYLREHLASALRQPRVRELAVLTMNDLEIACGHIEHGHRLPMLLHRWKFGSGKKADFAAYCSTTTGLDRHRRPRLVEKRWNGLMREVSSAFEPTARARLDAEAR